MGRHVSFTGSRGGGVRDGSASAQRVQATPSRSFGEGAGRRLRGEIFFVDVEREATGAARQGRKLNESKDNETFSCQMPPPVCGRDGTANGVRRPLLFSNVALAATFRPKPLIASSSIPSPPCCCFREPTKPLPGRRGGRYRPKLV